MAYSALSNMKALTQHSTQKLNKSNLSKLLHEYGNNSTIHGVSYILSNTDHICDRLLWLVIFLSSGMVTVMLTMRSYNNWQEHQVITTLQAMDRSIEGMDFPAITICSSGLYKDLIIQALDADFNEWKMQRNGNEEDLLEEFMSVNFGIANNKISLMDIIDTFVSPTKESNEANMVLQNELACHRSHKITRGKRETGNCQAQLSRSCSPSCQLQPSWLSFSLILHFIHRTVPLCQ